MKNRSWIMRAVALALLASTLTGCCILPPPLMGGPGGPGGRGYGGHPERGMEPRWNGGPPPYGYHGRGG